MYNIIFKSVAYLTIITSFFIILLYSGLSDNNTYYTWTDKNKVTHIDDNLTRITEKNIKNIKKFQSKQTESWVKKIISYGEINKNYPVYLLYGLILVFVILILFKNLSANYYSYINNKEALKKQNIFLKSGITKLTDTKFREISIKILEKLGFKLETTDDNLKNIIEYKASRGADRYGVAILISDNPVSHITINEVIREAKRFEYNCLILISNNIFSGQYENIKNEFKIIYLDKEKMAENIIKFGLNG